jgi:hypothetical protein
MMPQLLVVRCVVRGRPVSLKRIDARTIQETDTREGKVTDLAVSKVSADGKTMHVVDDDKLHGTKLTYTADEKAM